MTFDELLLLLAAESRRPAEVGLHVELKDATRLAAAGLDLEGAVVAALRDHGLAERRESGLHLQSFEPSCLRRLREVTDLRLVQLVDARGAPDDLRRPGTRRRTTTWSRPRGCGWSRGTPTPSAVDKGRLLGPGGRCRAGRPRAPAGLKVLAWTVRDENRFLAPASGAATTRAPR